MKSNSLVILFVVFGFSFQSSIGQTYEEWEKSYEAGNTSYSNSNFGNAKKNYESAYEVAKNLFTEDD